MVKINWLESARNDLKEIHEYIALDSLRYADLQIERIFERIEILKIQPKSGKVVSELKVDSIRELIEGNYRIIYKVKSDQDIDILLIHHSARELSKRL